PKPPIAPKPIPLSTFTCAETEQESNAITDQSYYISQVVDHVTFYNNNTYLIGLSIPGGWHVSGNKIVFTSGPWWTYAQHNVGLGYPSGVTMPHAAYPF